MLTASLAYGAENYYLKIESTKHGAFKGEVARKGGLWTPALEVVLPEKGQHQPVVVRKQVDAALQQFYRALTSNELLKQVVIDFVRTGPPGEETVYQTVTLTNANISSLKTIRPTGTAGMKEEDEISFTYQKIEVTDQLGKKIERLK